jgi:hypothetical protein
VRASAGEWVTFASLLFLAHALCQSKPWCSEGRLWGQGSMELPSG